MGVVGTVKASCSFCHRGTQLILAYSSARLAVLAAGKGRGGMMLFLLFLHFHSFPSFFPIPLFHLLYYLFYLFFSLSLEDDTKWPTRVDVSLNLNTINEHVVYMYIDMFFSLQADPIIIWGTPNRNWPCDICEQGTPRSACASARSMQTR